MVLISSPTNEWPQNQLVETDLMASTGKDVEKPGQDQPLKCPRCDSSNTKFCYYNNYSFSQPRHFCKACKRYWTRGGTLRNVPVGGGCRKNKRVKRNAPLSSSTDAASSASASAHPPEIRHASAPTRISSLFYGIFSNPNSDMNPPFPSFNSRVSNVETLPTSCTSFDLKSQFNPTTQIQDMDMVTSSSFLSNISLFGSSASSNTTPITNSSIASSIQQRKMVPGDLKETRTTDRFQALLPFEELKLSRNRDDEMVMKDEKMEEGNSKWYVTCQDQIEPIGSLDQSLYWNATSFGAWPDLNNFGSSITPLI